MKQNDLTDRLEKIMLADRGQNVKNILAVLESDLYRVISDFMTVRPENMRVQLVPSENGYLLTVAAMADRLLESGNVLRADI